MNTKKPTHHRLSHYANSSQGILMSKPASKWTEVEKALAELEVRQAMKSGFKQWQLDSPAMMQIASKMVGEKAGSSYYNDEISDEKKPDVFGTAKKI